LARTWATILTCRILAEQCCQGNHSHITIHTCCFLESLIITRWEFIDSDPWYAEPYCTICLACSLRIYILRRSHTADPWIIYDTCAEFYGSENCYFGYTGLCPVAAPLCYVLFAP
jgi:hypothetical protein